MAESRGRRIPENPVFATHSERAVWESLSASLTEGDVLIHGLRFSDAQHGDVEIDIMLLDAHRGVAVIEVKGGTVALADGMWTTTSSSGMRRRIHPVEQARRGKHSVRRYLDRQISWPFGLVRSQWVLAFPLTDVVGDMGPEGRRDLLIDRSQVGAAREIVNAALDGARNEAPVPEDPAWTSQAVDLLLSAPEASVSSTRHLEATSATGGGLTAGLALGAVALGSLAVVGMSVMAAGWPGGLAALALVLLAISGALYFLRRRHAPSFAAVFAVAVAAALLGGVVGGLVLRPAFLAWVPVASSPETVSGTPAAGSVMDAADPAKPRGACLPDYTPCVPSGADLHCRDIGFRVHLTGTSDPYGLDLDNDGVGCELYPEKAIQPSDSSPPVTLG